MSTSSKFDADHVGKPINIMICGQVRNEEALRTAVSQFRHFRSLGVIDRITFSTWSDEIDRYPGLRAHLLDSSVELTETIVPMRHMEVDAYGHFFHQALQAIAGLDKFAPDDFVFKTRAESRINIGLNFVTVKEFWERRDRESPPANGFLRHRIGIGCYGPLIPFFFEDRYFYGCCADLRKMVRLSRSPDIAWNPHTAIAEARWYGTMFSEAFPVVRQMMRIFWIYRLHPHDPGIFQREVIFKAMAVYHYLLESFFTTEIEPLCYNPAAFLGTLEPPPVSVSPLLDPGVVACSAQSAYLEAREALAINGLDYLAQPAMIQWFQAEIDQLSRDTQQVLADFVLPAASLQEASAILGRP